MRLNMDEVGDNEGEVRKGQGGGQRVAYIPWASACICRRFPDYFLCYNTHIPTNQIRKWVLEDLYVHVNLHVHTRKHMYIRFVAILVSRKCDHGTHPHAYGCAYIHYSMLRNLHLLVLTLNHVCHSSAQSAFFGVCTQRIHATQARISCGTLWYIRALHIWYYTLIYRIVSIPFHI